MRLTTSTDPLHPALILSPGEVFLGEQGLHLKNDSNTFEMYVQLVDEVDQNVYRTWDEGRGFLVYSIHPKKRKTK